MLTGAAGTAAQVTNSGTAYAAVLDFTIPQGAKGDKGEQGTVDSGALSGYLPLAGGTCTGSVSAPSFQTGTAAANYFQCRRFRGEGDANTYYHAVDFGYSGHDSVDFYEYDANWNFYQCTTGTKSGAVLVGNINGNGWNGGARLTGAPTAPTATAGTSNTQIATTAFVQKAIPTNVSSFVNDAGYLTQHQSLTSYVKSSELKAVAKSGSYNDLSDKPFIPTVPTDISAFTNDAGYLTQHQPLDGYAKTSVENTWTAQQNFYDLMLNREKYTTYVVNGTSDTPITSTMVYAVVGAFTLDLATLAGALSASQSSVFTAYFAANADYSLTISNAGKLKYVGSASDVAITSAGLLLNIWMSKDGGGTLTSIVQASKLS